MRRTSLLTLAGLAGVCVAGLPAQAPRDCTYDRCAMRVEHQRLVRGVPGAETDVGQLGLWSPPRLAVLVQQSDSARYHAELFERHYRAGARLSLLGGAVGGALLGLGWRASDERDGWRLAAASVPFLALSLYGEHRRSVGRRALARAIWWYNRDLAR